MAGHVKALRHRVPGVRAGRSTPRAPGDLRRGHRSERLAHDEGVRTLVGWLELTAT